MFSSFNWSANSLIFIIRAESEIAEDVADESVGVGGGC